MVSITFASSGGLLLGRYDAPEGPAPAAGPVAAVVCHPHPLHGGTLDNKVVHATAAVLRERGLAVLRFDFRGAGGSEGVHDGGAGECDDLRAAIAELAGRAEADGRPLGRGALLLAGFSFGSWIASRLAVEDDRVGAVLVIAPPVNHYDYGDLAAEATRPLAVIYAHDDEVVPAAAVEAWLATCAGRPFSVPVVGSGHLFHGKLGPLRDGVSAFADVLAAGPDAGRG